ncbi:MAG: hypothetical protein AB1646_20635 [Thermodesulfobacteriota bacterium]
MLRDIRCLGEKYPPALDALQDLRDEGEQSILAGMVDDTTLKEVVALNDVLDTVRRSLDLLDKLRFMGARFDPHRRTLTRLMTDTLRTLGRYDELSSIVETLVLRVATDSFLSEFIRVQPIQGLSKTQNDAVVRYHHRSLVSDGLMAYETLLFTRKLPPAVEIEERLLNLDRTPRMYALLVQSALVVKAAIHAQVVIRKANHRLSPQDRRLFQTYMAHRHGR